MTSLDIPAAKATTATTAQGHRAAAPATAAASRAAAVASLHVDAA
jgi:hypothetical protein